MKKLVSISVFVVILAAGYLFLQKNKDTPSTLSNPENKSQTNLFVTTSPEKTNPSNPLAVKSMREKLYPGSPLSFEEALVSGSNFRRYLVSYQSDGLKQYGLLTIPSGGKPDNGWPVVLFNHGYIPPREYSTENSYASFVNLLASEGYIVFKPDYRGNGNSQGTPIQIYVSPDYLTDSMNALASIKQYRDANPQKIGVFGHSMGGNITLHELVISKDIKAAEIMAGVVGDETGILAWWNKRIAQKSIAGNDLDTSYKVRQMITDHGTPVSNPDYWNGIDATNYVKEVTAPVQIQVGTADTAVPPGFSSSLRDKLQTAGKTVEYKEYSGADHNLSPYTSTALSETVKLFDKYLK